MNARVGASFDGDEVETIGGFAFSRFGRVPEVGDRVEADGYAVDVDAVEETRSERLVVERLGDRPAEDPDDPDERRE